MQRRSQAGVRAVDYGDLPVVRWRPDLATGIFVVGALVALPGIIAQRRS